MRADLKYYDAGTYDVGDQGMDGMCKEDTNIKKLTVHERERKWCWPVTSSQSETTE